MKEWKGRNYDFDFTDPSKPVRTFRSRRPCHFIFEIESYDELVASLKKANKFSFETPEFSTGNEKWTMCFYPEGNVAKGGKGYISMYVKRQKNSAGRNKEINVAIKFFILDQTSGEYLVIEDLGEKHFDVRGKEWGIAQALEFKHFKNPDNGFYVDNSCTIGAEISITSTEPHYSKMSHVTTISRSTFNIIKLGPFDNNTPEPVDSNITFVTSFDGEPYTWKLQLYREGYGSGNGTHFSLYLVLVDNDKLSNGNTMLVNFELSLLNKYTGAYANEKPLIDWFTHSKVSSGFPEFIKGNEVFSSTNRFFEGGSLDVKVHFNSIFIINDAEG
ncbi:uncharacterized protein LOC104900727 [Beta vulgaris subsp. vulgaris]|uniref:uncharacterized protein LOC104900727 n=1 Tax=Beta vulgaris subsp. vulgaris TaxID=3555 RepID=UPI002036FB35|nr:uncharacterized protein LOC104900727 [Beta vulgaris subsp. vulgaris]